MIDEFSRMSLQRFRASRSIPPLTRHPLTAVGGQPLQTHPAELPQTVIPASVVSSRWLQRGIGSRKISEDAADLKLLNRITCCHNFATEYMRSERLAARGRKRVPRQRRDEAKRNLGERIYSRAV